MKKIAQKPVKQAVKQCCLYYRVSSDPQENLRQESECLDFCKDNGYNVQKIFQEKQSGRKEDRLQMTNCLEYIKANGIQFLIMAEISRLSRSLEGASIIHRLTHEKVNVIGIRDEIKTLTDDFQEDREMTAKASQAVTDAIKESNRISYRVTKGKRAKVLSKGIWTGGKYLPFGYHSVNGILTVEPQEALIVKKIFEMYYNGDGSIKIANWLNNQKISTKLGYKWTRTTINQMLKHKIYFGLRIYKDEQVYVKELKIIDVIIYNACQKRMTESQNVNFDFNQLKKYDYLFDKKLIKCEHCGKYYIGYGKQNYYKCVSGKYSGGCGNPSINKDWLEQTVKHQLFKKWFRLLADNLQTNANIQKLELESQQQEIQQQVQQQQMDNANELYIMGRYTKEKYDDKYNKANNTLTKVQDNIKRINEQIEANKAVKAVIVNEKYGYGKDSKLHLQYTGIDKAVLHKVIKAIHISKVSGNQFIDVEVINGNKFNINRKT